MTIEEAIKRIESTKDYLRECRDEELKTVKFQELKPLIKGTYKENAQSLDLALSALREKSERDNPQPQWVSVVDRLPEKFEKILAYTPAHKDGMNNFAECLESTKGMMVLIKKSEVTHWMPLPEPPKEGHKCTQT